MAAKRRQVQLTPLAETDLEEIWPYTSQRWSLKQAEHYHHDLVETLETLARDDKIGRPWAARHGYLRYPVGSHVMFYRETDSTLDVSGCRINEWTSSDTCSKLGLRLTQRLHDSSEGGPQNI
jgi:toxin ParE1/3/4